MSGQRKEGPKEVTQIPLTPVGRLRYWFNRNETFYQINSIGVGPLQEGGFYAHIRVEDHGTRLTENTGTLEDLLTQVMNEWKEKWRPNPKPQSKSK